MKLLQRFFISVAISLKPLEDGGYDLLGFSHKPECVAPAASPQEQPPLHRVSWCPLHSVHDCLLIQESHLVGNRDGQQGKEAEVLQQLSCSARAWRKPPRDFPH